MASIARLTSERVPGKALLAIPHKVSFARTWYVEPGSIPDPAPAPARGALYSVGGARSSAGGARSSAGGMYVSAGAGRGAAVVARGVATGVSATAGPGAYTGGSS